MWDCLVLVGHVLHRSYLQRREQLQVMRHMSICWLIVSTPCKSSLSALDSDSMFWRPGEEAGST